MTNDPIPQGIRPVEPAYRHSLRLQSLSSALVLIVAAIAADRLFLDQTPLEFVAPVIALVLAFITVVLLPSRRYRRLGYALDERLLRVVRGWLFHVDTVVPFVRVQHIDVTRGPFDKIFGLASLVVHTAGTHNSVVILPGLKPDTAAGIRDRIRAEIRADWE